MAVLLTRPEPDNATSADALRARGFAVLRAPMLHVQALAFRVPDEMSHDGVIVTSANALRVISAHPLRERLAGLPLFAVGQRTADAAKAAGFDKVLSAGGDVASLRKLIVGTANRTASLLYLAGAELSADLAADLAADEIAVTTVTIYRVVTTDEIPADVAAAFADHAIEAVLHYSRRSAAAFVATLRRAGLEIAGLGVLQLCISEAVARVLREAGAASIAVADRPEEAAMFDALERALQSRRL